MPVMKMTALRVLRRHSVERDAAPIQHVAAIAVSKSERKTA
jgi:hypothetical protein